MKSATFRRDRGGFGIQLIISVSAAKRRGGSILTYWSTRMTFCHWEGRGTCVGHWRRTFRLRMTAGVHHAGGGRLRCMARFAISSNIIH